MLCGLFDNSLGGACNAEVTTDGNGLAAKLFDCGANGFRGFGVLIVVNRNACAEPAKFKGGGGADAGAGPGDENGFSTISSSMIMT